jgi:uncharacterized protein
LTKERTAKYWKEKLHLTSHVEGGSFSEVFRSDLMLPQESLTKHHNGSRNAMTSIYFLLEHRDFSAFHRIASDELWHHYDGGILCIYEIKPNGTLTKHLLGIEGSALPFVAIAAGSWFASRVEEASSFTLCGCTVAPGFDFADFELANRWALQQQFPDYKNLIAELTRQ